MANYQETAFYWKTPKDCVQVPKNNTMRPLNQERTSQLCWQL